LRMAYVLLKSDVAFF